MMIFFVLYRHKVYNNPCNMMFHTSEYFDVIILPKVLVFIEVLKCLKYLKVSLPVSLIIFHFCTISKRRI